MTKISKELEKYSSAEEIVKYYKKTLEEWKEKSTDLEDAVKKGKRIKLIQIALGDIDIKDEYMDAFLDLQLSLSESHSDIKRMYELIKDAAFSKNQVSAIMETYELIKRPEMYDKLKEAIDQHKDLYISLDKICDSSRMHAIVGSYKIEFLKDDCRYGFYSWLQRMLREGWITVESLMDILPSKEFMEYSMEKARELNQKESKSIIYKSAEDLVLRRLEDKEAAKRYSITEPDHQLYLGYTEYGYGNTIYTSFTKGEYEEDLGKTKIIRKSKGDSYVGW